MEMCWNEYKDDSFHVKAMLTWLFKWEVYQNLERKEKGGRREKDKRKKPNMMLSTSVFLLFFFWVMSQVCMKNKGGKLPYFWPQ